MKNLISIFIIFIVSFSLSAQEIKIISQIDSLPIIKKKGLVFIHPQTKLQDYYFVGSVDIVAKDFHKIYTGLQSIAVDLFANAFKYKGQKNADGRTTVSFDLFSVSEEHLKANAQNRERNVICFFGNDKKPQKFKIDDRKIDLVANQIYRFEIPEKKEVKINRGGFTGMTLFHQWTENQPVIFYAFGSGNISFSGDGYSSIGLAVNTGNILELKSDYAYLFMELIK